MLSYLYSASDSMLFLILSCVFISITLLALFFIRYLLPLHLRYQENNVIGYTSALIGVIYGVIAGFATAHLINNNNYAVDALQREANAIANIYRDSLWLNEPTQSHIQTDIKHYLHQVLDVEWPLMKEGQRVTHEGDVILSQITNELSHYTVSNNSQSQILADILTVSRNLYDARHQRILSSYTSLGSAVWVVILLGTILTLCISYLFGINFYLHIFIALGATLMTTSIIFLLISLDKPFQGDFILGPVVFEPVAALINKN